MLQAALSHGDPVYLPRLLPFSASSKPFSSQQRSWQLPSGKNRYPCRKAFEISASSSSKRPRNGRKVKSNEELCSEIREFVSLVGLPEGHVPSTKELSEHGRNDLANIVRRRGYKLIKELLVTYSSVDNNDFHAEKAIVENHGAICDSEDKSTDESTETGRGGGITMKYDDAIQSRMSSGKGEIGGTAMTSNGAILMSRAVAPQAVNHASWSHSATEGEQLISYDGEKDLSTKATKENQVEINHLRSMLHQKELELLCLREQIKKEKIAMSALQTKAEAEIWKAQKLISEKDAELDAAEESLSGLKEVSIQYSGECEIVEVTGSFNGWHHRIKLDPQPSSGAVDPIGLRKPGLWSTMLWLYPGTYEIKFIIDGQWRIDPQRESITMSGFCNNILRVDR